MRKYFLFDCETGGICKDTSLLTLYGMVLDEKLEIEDTISLEIKPNDGVYHVEAGAMAVNKIDLINHDKQAITEDTAARHFDDFICRYSLVEKLVPTGHNLSLDVDFAKKTLLPKNDLGKRDWLDYFSYRSLDTATIAQGLILAGKLPNNLECSLSSLARHFGYDYSGAHNAEFDAKLTLEILRRLIELIKNV